jgi:hypothetical protein
VPRKITSTFILGAIFVAGNAGCVPGAGDARPVDPFRAPRGYVAYRAQASVATRGEGQRVEPIRIDGKLDDEAWQAAPWTEDFVDIEGETRPRPRFRTRAKMLWDDHNFYIGAELEEPHVLATFTKHDSHIFQEDNDFEVFLNPNGNNHHYAELEMNALNTTWDLRLRKPYRDGGQAEDDWEIPGLKTAVHVNGSINNPRDLDKGWSIEIAIPWAIVRALDLAARPAAGARTLVPRDGEQWRVNFSRVEWCYDVVDGKYVRRKEKEDNWVWSPQGVVNMHRPERWGYVQFSTAPPGKGAFRTDPAGPAKHVLHQVYYAQSDFHAKNKHYAATLAELNLARLDLSSLKGPPVLETRGDRYRATVDLRRPDGLAPKWRIREDSLVEPLSK